MVQHSNSFKRDTDTAEADLSATTLSSIPPIESDIVLYVVSATEDRLGSLNRRQLYGRSVETVLHALADSENGLPFSEIAATLQTAGGIAADKVLSVCRSLDCIEEQNERITLSLRGQELLAAGKN